MPVNSLPGRLTPYSLMNKLREPKSKKPSPKQQASVLEAVASAKKRFIEAKAKKDKRRNEKKVWSLKDLHDFWIAHSDAVDAPTRKDMMILQGGMKNFRESVFGYRYVDLLKWSLENWSSIIQAEFRFAKRPPTEPSVRWFVKCIAAYRKCYERKEKTMYLASLTTRERMIAKLEDEGRYHDDAVREVDEILGLHKIKEEIRQKEESLKRFQIKQMEDAEAQRRLGLMKRTAKRKEAKAVEQHKRKGTFERWV